MYDGTLSADWQAMVVFQQMIVLADSEGVVDITPPAISRRTGIPLDIIEYGIKKLEEADPYSRSPNDNGKRITLIDDHRPWGWIIVNYEFYRDLASREDRREQNRINKQKQRDREKSSDVSISQQSSAMSAHEDEDANEDEDINTEAWKEFEKHRKAIKKPLTKQAAKLQKNKLKGLSKDQQAEVINRTIENRWTGLFPPENSDDDLKGMI